MEEYYLFSKVLEFKEDDLASFLDTLKQKCHMPPQVRDSMIKIICKKRLVATGWRNCWKAGYMGKEFFVYDYFIQINVDGVSEEKKTAFSAFWNGFLCGRDSKKFS